jgi:uncharacterized membrane protein
MTDYALPSGMNSPSFANTALKASARFWFVVAVLGQLMFAYYVLFTYGSWTVQGNFAAFNESLPHGYVAGETAGNLAVVLHVLLAVIITVGGPLQLIPAIRARLPAFHRWNGRIYLVTVCATALIGLFMVWTRGTVGGPPQKAGITLDAILILVFAVIAVRYAMARNIRIHRRWALRLFIVVSAVWFYRVGLMGWFVFTGGVGIDMEAFRGPFLAFLAFGQYLVPLAILELYFLSQDKAGPRGKLAMSAGLFIATLVMAVGIFAATMGMWLPRL